MRIGFIGAGVMGKTMGSLLGACGYEIAGYFSRSETSAYRATKEVGGKFYSDAAKLAASCDVLFIIPGRAVKSGSWIKQANVWGLGSCGSYEPVYL